MEGLSRFGPQCKRDVSGESAVLCGAVFGGLRGLPYPCGMSDGAVGALAAYDGDCELLSGRCTS